MRTYRQSLYISFHTHQYFDTVTSAYIDVSSSRHAARHPHPHVSSGTVINPRLPAANGEAKWGLDLQDQAAFAAVRPLHGSTTRVVRFLRLDVRCATECQQGNPYTRVTTMLLREAVPSNI